MISAGAGESISDDFFTIDTEDDDDPPKSPPRSPEMAALLAKSEERASRRRGKSKTVAASVFNRALAEVDVMIESGDWTGAGVRHLVAYYDRMHFKCYGIEAEELGPTERYNAMMLAANMVKHKFEGEIEACAAFMEWAWSEEARKERWCRDNGRPRHSRIGVRLMFSGALLTDYRLAIARGSANP